MVQIILSSVSLLLLGSSKAFTTPTSISKTSNHIINDNNSVWRYEVSRKSHALQQVTQQNSDDKRRVMDRRINKYGPLYSVSTDNDVSTETSSTNSNGIISKMKSINSITNDNNNGNNNERLLGILVLMSVPLSWGTYAPVVKYVYEMDPPLPGFVFSAGYYFIASITLTFLSIMAGMKQQKEQEQGEQENGARIMNIAGDTNAKAEDFDINLGDETEGKTTSKNLPLQTLAGIELGSYLFLGNCLQVVGLKSIPADRAAFLVQLTTIMVPLLQAGFSGNLNSIPVPTWIACALAFVGVIVMGLDRPDINIDLDRSSLLDNVRLDGMNFNGLAEGLAFSGGDTLIILAAVSYSMHVIRLGTYAKYTSPLGLAASKATVEAILSTALVAALLGAGSSTDMDFITDMSSEIQSYFTQIQDAVAGGSFPPHGSGKALGACLWTGWITCAYTIYAQSFGQRRVEPTDANLIYTMQPIFSALFAWALLGETLGLFGYVGASFIFGALWVVTSDQQEDENEAFE